jgi:hypothetical protein
MVDRYENRQIKIELVIVIQFRFLGFHGSEFSDQGFVDCDKM